jgi:hypothetical protein
VAYGFPPKRLHGFLSGESSATTIAALVRWPNSPLTIAPESENVIVTKATMRQSKRRQAVLTATANAGRGVLSGLILDSIEAAFTGTACRLARSADA